MQHYFFYVSTDVKWKTCKDHFGLFLNTNTGSARSKNALKLIVVDANHFVRYRCKIMHCLDSQTISDDISTVALDDNPKLSSMKC